MAKGSDLITKSLFQDWTGLFGKKIKIFLFSLMFIVTQTCADAACSCTDTGLAEDPIGPGKY